MPAVQTLFTDTILDGKNLMAVNISKTYPNRHDPDGRGSTYECARKYWRVSKKRVESKVAPGRFEFEGEKVREGDFVGKDVTSLFAGRSNPVKYL